MDKLYYINTHFLPYERHNDYDLIRAKCHFFGARSIRREDWYDSEIKIWAIFSRKEWADEAYENIEEFIGDIGKSYKIADYERLQQLLSKAEKPILVGEHGQT